MSGRLQLRDVSVERVLRSLGLDARREGSEWVSQCPSGAHPDHRPSWSIRDEPGHEKHCIHRCWSCGFSGNAITLARDVLGVGWAAAEEWVREHASGEGAPEPSVVRVEIAPVGVPAFHLPEGVVVAPMAEWPEEYRAYALSRGITEAQSFRWGLGYADSGRLRGRLVIPVRDSSGRLLSYTARGLPGSSIRYLTPREDERADKGAVFGEQHWSSAGATLFLCEGAINALAVDRVVPGASVSALGGSKLQPGHVLRLSRFRRVVVLTDADLAGDRAAEAVAGALARHCWVARVALPAGEDPASMSPEALALLLSRVG